MEIATDVVDRRELGQRVRERRVDLAMILTELWRDPVDLERGVDLLLGLRRDLLAAGLSADAVEAVLVQQQLPLQRMAAEPDVVLLRAGEVDHRGAPGARRDDTQVDLQTAADDDRGLRVPLREHALHAGGSGERPHDRRRIVGGDKEIDVADGLAVSADAARDADPLDAARAERLDHLARLLARVGDQRASGGLLQRPDRLQDVLFGLRLDLRQLAKTSRLRRLFELIDGRDAELLVDDASRRGPYARHAQERDEPFGDRGFQLGVPLRCAGGDELRDSFRHRRTGLRDLGETALLQEHGHGLAQVPDRARDLPVGHRTEDVLTLELEEITDLVKDGGDAFVVDGDGIPWHESMLSAAGELHVMECRVDLTARAQPLRVLGGDGRAVWAVVDLGQELDGLAVGAVAGLVRTEGVVRGADDAQRVGALHAVDRKRLL